MLFCSPEELRVSYPFRNHYFFVALLLVMSSAAFCGDISINGTCYQGNCPPVTGNSDALHYLGSLGPIFGSQAITVGVDNDPYLVSWVTSGSYNSNGTFVMDSPTVTYTGSSPTTTNDIISVDFFQSFYDSSPGTWDGNYTEYVPLQLSASAPAGSSVEGQLFIDTTAFPLVGPAGPGSNTYTSNTEDLVGFTGDTSDNLVYEYAFTFDFQAGTTTGTTSSSVTPEPSEALPLALAFAGLVLFGSVRRRRFGYSK